jgi:hypothetical protein
MTNYKTTIGGAVSSLGTGLIGMSIVPQLAGIKSNWLLGITVAGYVINLIGKFLTSLFAADAAALQKLSDKVDAAIPPNPIP